MADSRADELAREWADQLAAWAIPEDILDAAPESPWGFPPELFARSAQAALAEEAPTPSRQRAVEALGEGGTVLDVGAGAGAASLPLVPPADRIVAVDESESMLAAFREAAAQQAVASHTVHGRWPDVAGSVETADVVVCHHVLYNVAAIVPFVEALSSHARRRVVIEITERHPQAELNPLWKELHGIDRPDRPRAGDAAAVLGALGLEVGVERFERPSRWGEADRAAQIAFARRRLCVGPDRDAEIDRLLPIDSARQLCTLWWDYPAASS